MVQLYRRAGADALVNTQTDLSQGGSDIAVLPGGGYVVVWQGVDSSPGGIKAQLFDSEGNKVGGEFLVNSTTAGSQSSAFVAALPSGRFVVTWSDPSATGGDTAGFAVRGQMFEANGTPVGGEFIVNTETASNQTASAITALAGGGFVISWTDNSLIGGDNSSLATKAQIFDSTGAKVGGEILVNTVTQGSQASSTLVALPSGGFAVSWISNSLAAPVQVAVKLQLFDPAGAKIGGEIGVNGTLGVNFSRPNIAALPDGFLVTWAQQDNPGVIAPNPITYDVRAQKFDLSGAKVGSEFIVNAQSAGTQFNPDAFALPGGGYIITWQGFANGPSGSDVFGQIFDSAGARVGTQFVVSSDATGDQFNPEVAVLPSGDIVLVWTTEATAEGGGSGLDVNSTILTPSSAPPNDIAISATSLTENAIENVAVATLSAVGAVNSGFTYSIRSDSTGGAFRVDGDRLVVHDNAKLDFETAPQAAVTIRATDVNGQTYDEELVLEVTDIVNERRLSAGGEMRVNVNETGAQYGSTVVPLAGGGYAVLWIEYNPTPNDSSPNSTFLRLYNSAGVPQSGEILIAERWIPDLDAVPLANGGLMVTMDAFTFPEGQRILKAQGYDSAGNPNGTQIVLGGFQYHFAAMATVELANGDFVIAWGAFPNNEIRARRFDSDGTPIGGEFTITTQLSATPIGLVATPDGGFGVSWISTEGNPEQGDPDQATVRFYDSSNAPVGTLLVDIGSDGGSLTLLALADGGYLLGWRELVGEDESGLTLQAVMGQRIGADRSAIGEPILLAGYVGHHDQGTVSFAANPGGGFAATWPMIGGAITEGSVTYIYNSVEGRYFDSAGSPVGPQIQFSAMAGDSHVAVLENGAIVGTWGAADSNEGGVFARLFSPANEPVDNSGNDVLTGDGNANRLDGGAGDDRLYGLGGDDTLIGGVGNDALYGGGGGDRMEGGPGDDVYLVDHVGDVVVELVDEGADTVATSINYALTAHVENLQAANIGGSDPLSLTGNALNNFIWGTQGNNSIDGGGGADFMIGYAGNDFYHVDHVSDIVYELEGGGADTVATVISYTLAANVENLQSANIGGTAALTLTGNAMNNFIWGTQGNNILNGGGGADFLIGYAGDDIYHVDHVSDIAYELEGGGSDTAVASISYTLAANVENLQALNIGGTAPLALTGNALGNFIWATQGNNVIDGGAGVDFMIGYGGNDVYYVDNGGDVTIEEADGGEDTVAALASYALGAHIENLQAANIGGTAALSLTGNEQGNFIWGTQGNNVIAGRGGNDRIFGYAGADQFLFNTAAGNANFDWLDDFQAGVDKIVLDNAVFTALTDGALPSSAFVAGSAALDADDRILFNAADGSVWYDADGNGAGAALLVAYVPVGQALTAADFQVL